MSALIIRDSAKIQSQDAERQHRHLEREGKPPRKPLYETAEAEQIISQAKSVPYTKPFPVAEGVDQPGQKPAICCVQPASSSLLRRTVDRNR
jgi:hypothetical protein